MNLHPVRQAILTPIIVLAVTTASTNYCSAQNVPTLPMFGGVANIGEAVNAFDDVRNPFVTSDGMTLLFQVNPTVNGQQRGIYQSTRPNTEQLFGEPVFVDELLVGLTDAQTINRHPALSADGNLLLFSSIRDGSRDIFSAERTGSSLPFGDVTSLGSGINSADNDSNPSLSHDGNVLLFSSNRADGFGDSDLYMATRRSPLDSWGNVANLGDAINSPFGESSPSISSDGRMLVFSSTRDGGFGGSDLYASVRASHNKPWSDAFNLGPMVNTDANEAGPHVAADASTIYFHSDRPGSFAGNDIFAATPIDDPLPNNVIYNFTGTVSFLEDLNFDFPDIFLGDAVTGTFGYDVNAEGDDIFGDGGLSYFQPPPVPEMSFTVGGVTFRGASIDDDFGIGQIMDVFPDEFIGDEFAIFQFAEIPDGITAFGSDMLDFMRSIEHRGDASLPTEINLDEWVGASISFMAFSTEDYDFEDPYDIIVEAVIESLELVSTNQPILAGDFNSSGNVEQGDLDLVLLNWGLNAIPIPDGWTTDLPAGQIDQEELDTVLLNWGNTSTAAIMTASVPEPGTLMLLLISVASLLGMQQARR